MPHILPVTPSASAWQLHDLAASRHIEQRAQEANPPHALMARAGLAVARLVCATAPHARTVWVAAGPGNNGGDGLMAARLLQAWGRQVVVTLLAEPSQLPPDAAWAWHEAREAGVAMVHGLAQPISAQVCIDALLGLGATRPASGQIALAVAQLNQQSAPVVAVDLPSALAADTGEVLGNAAVRATHTLALLTLKPGLFTAAGRDHAGQVWLDRLGVDLAPNSATALLAGPASPPTRHHAQHKGTFGNVLVLGGAPGMGGAALLAARAALSAGAGRVYLCRLGPDALDTDPTRPELMPRDLRQTMAPALLAASTVVCGCGGGEAVAALLETVLPHAARLVLDADALNALAAQPALWPLLAARGRPTVLTPHPLEAARLLGCSTEQVQADRIGAAQALAERSQAVVVLKGSGTVIAAPGRLPVVNPTGNARLGTAGTGDVLAGWLGGWLAAWGFAGCDPAGSAAAQDCASASVWLHGRAAECGDARLPLRAADLVDAMALALKLGPR